MTDQSGRNTMIDIRDFLATSGNLKEGEFKEFWDSLTEEEKEEFRTSPLK